MKNSASSRHTLGGELWRDEALFRFLHDELRGTRCKGWRLVMVCRDWRGRPFQKRRIRQIFEERA